MMIKKSKHFKVIKGIPCEEERVQADLDLIDEYFDKLEQIILRFLLNLLQMLTKFVIKHGKMQLSKKVVVPASYSSDTISVPVSRTEKRSSAVAGIF